VHAYYWTRNALEHGSSNCREENRRTSHHLAFRVAGRRGGSVTREGERISSCAVAMYQPALSPNGPQPGEDGYGWTGSVASRAATRVPSQREKYTRFTLHLLFY
jgi:hypothetical protein